MNDANRSLMRRAWLVVGLLFPVALLNYLDRQMIASMKVSVMGDIQDIGSEANWGHHAGVSSSGCMPSSAPSAATSPTASAAS
jgi:hypothetical protein